MYTLKSGTLLIYGFFLTILSGISGLSAQAPMPAKHAGELQLDLKHLQVLGSVLYVAAHPDDENTRLLAYLAGERGYRTSYLSLTRGDGGQNLIGDEKGNQLGILRTQELLAARRIDGAEQMFSRAIDFGYSKNPEETQQVWDREKILGDVVWAIRKFRPDVIITRFAEPDRGGGGHGHHTTSAILAREAFHLANDPSAYPNQLKHVDTWQPRRIFWNMYTWRWYKPDEKDLPRITELNIDAFNPLLGKGYAEIAAESRSMHKCQAFGAAKIRGKTVEKLLRVEGDPIQKDIFDDIDASWSRVKEGKEIGDLLGQAYDDFRPATPHTIVPTLLQAYQKMKKKEGYWFEVKRQQLEELIAYCSGLYFEVNASEAQTAINDSVFLTASVIKRSPFPVELAQIKVNGQAAVKVEEVLENNEELKKFSMAFPLKGFPFTQPYWLQHTSLKGTYQVEDQSLIGLPETPTALAATYTFLLGEDKVPLRFATPVVYKYVDPARGELYSPWGVSPAFTAEVAEKVYLYANDDPQEIRVKIKSHSKESLKASVVFDVPEGWRVEPNQQEVTFEEKGKEKSIDLKVYPSASQSVGELAVSINGQAAETLIEISYDHIPSQRLFEPAKARLVRVDLEKKGHKIGYIMGSGDEIPICLEQIGYEVDILSDAEVNLENLRQYDAVIAGIRAYNTRKRMPYHRDELMKYIEQGGNYIVQYNTSRGAITKQEIGPYPLTLSRDRVTVEEAPITFLQPDHPALNFPNKITEADFEGWIQERGLYFAGKWDEKYQAITASNDPGEDPKEGALLVAQYGKGYFVYTGYSWFRELPAGIPGAYRIFTNLISLGSEQID